ncbi:MAG: DUF3857 domain-containing protein [Flavobacteriaceae bacterium]
MRSVFLILFYIVTSTVFSQDGISLGVGKIPEELTTGANAVVRLASMEINILSQDKMLIKNKRIVTVLNSNGDSKVGAVYHYDSNNKLKVLEAMVYDAMGKEIKKIKKKDFADVSATDGFSLYTDSRLKYLKYTPVNYPYTVEFTEEYETSFTVGIPGWYPLEGYSVSVEKSIYSIVNNSGIEMSVKTKNLENYKIENKENQYFEVTDLKAMKYEAYSPGFSNFSPSVKVALKQFNIEGVGGINNNWQDFGKWINEKLLNNTTHLSEDTLNEIKALTADAETDIEKAKIVYHFVQEKTRYISVQVGIGGWKPMLASDVDRLGYGDCKGLSNYTKALMDAVGIKAYYTIIYGDRDVRSIDSHFSSLQGNHVILCLPQQNNAVWLECTNQTVPFGYIANFTDDRDALVITPEGGEIKHTTVYNTIENLLDSKSKIKLDEAGGFQATITTKSYGTQYYYHERIMRKNHKDQVLHYKNYWSYLNTLQINDYNFNNDKDSIVFTEDVVLKAAKYATKAGNRLLVQPNFFNRIEDVPPKYSSRKLPFEVDRGFVDSDEFEIEIPDTYELEAAFEPISISNKFGSYSASVNTSEGNIIYKRKIQLNKGSYTKEEYDTFRKFWQDVVKYDKSKIVLKPK